MLKIFRENPNHALARVVKSEIKKTHEFWSRIIDGLFPDPGFGLGPVRRNDISPKEYDKVRKIGAAIFC